MLAPTLEFGFPYLEEEYREYFHDNVGIDLLTNEVIFTTQDSLASSAESENKIGAENDFSRSELQSVHLVESDDLSTDLGQKSLSIYLNTKKVPGALESVPTLQMEVAENAVPPPSFPPSFRDNEASFYFDYESEDPICSEHGEYLDTNDPACAGQIMQDTLQDGERPSSRARISVA